MSTNPKPSKRVAIMVPLSNRGTFTADEEISLRHLRYYLGAYDRFAVVPQSLKIELPDFALLRFEDQYFGSAANHNRLLVSPNFYRAFADYEFLLTYHLDALVFSDKLQYWCDVGYDFIGPPWVSHADAPYRGKPLYEGKVGNGGFSLKRVAAFLDVLEARVPAIIPGEFLRQQWGSKDWRRRLKALREYALLHSAEYNNVRWELRRFRGNEDAFWANRAAHYYPGFRVAPVEDALRFAFECVPSYCFELSNRQLPFGCHAWQKYDRKFWEPYLLAPDRS